MTENNVATHTTEAGLSSERTDVVRRFFGMWAHSKATAMSAFDQYFTPDTVWENVGLETTVGIVAAQTFAAGVPPEFETMVATIENVAEQGRFVFTERVDDFYNAAGELLVSARGIGIAEVDGGRILSMRDYFITPGAEV